MIRSVTSLAAVAAAAVLVAGCGSDSSAHSSAESRLSQITAATQPSASSSAHTSGPTIDLASVDVCSLLTAADANSAAHTEMLDPFQDASTVYTLTATKQPAGCKFRISPPKGEDGQGSVVFHVASAKSFETPPDGKPISGLGNEAYDTGVSPVVRVGNVKLYSDDNSFPDSMTVALLRKMVPKLK